MAPFIRNPDFSPETLELLDRAFTDTWRELQLKNAPAVAKARDSATREWAADRGIARAKLRQATEFAQ